MQASGPFVASLYSYMFLCSYGFRQYISEAPSLDHSVNARIAKRDMKSVEADLSYCIHSQG